MTASAPLDRVVRIENDAGPLPAATLAAIPSADKDHLDEPTPTAARQGATRRLGSLRALARHKVRDAGPSPDYAGFGTHRLVNRLALGVPFA